MTGKTGVHSSSRGMCLRRDYHDHHYHCYHDYHDHHYHCYHDYPDHHYHCYHHYPDYHDNHYDDDEDLDERETCKTLGHCDTT